MALMPHAGRIDGRTLVAACATLTLLSTADSADAAGKCDESGAAVAITSAVGVGVGAAAGLISSGVITATDDTRDYSFGIGAGVAIGVTAGLTGLYALVDGASGCMMAYDSGGYIVWSVPITMFVLGALLPIAIWGAADDSETGTSDQALQGAMASPTLSQPSLSTGLTLRF